MNLMIFKIGRTLLIISIACLHFFNCAGANKKQTANMPQSPTFGLEETDSANSPIMTSKESQNIGWIIARSANVREQPNIDSRVLTTLRKGQPIVLDQLIGDWWKITAHDTLTGFINASLVLKSEHWTFDLPWDLSFHMSFEDVRKKLNKLNLSPERFITTGGCCFVEGDVSILGCKAFADLTFNGAGNLIHIIFDFNYVEEDPNQINLYRDNMANTVKNSFGNPVLEGNAIHNARYSYSPDVTIYGLGFRAADNSFILFKDEYWQAEYLSKTTYQPRKVLANHATLEFCAPEVADSILSESWK